MNIESIRKKAKDLGFDDVGITHATLPENVQREYIEWIEKGYHAKMAFMEKAFRCDPKALFKEAKSAIIFVSFYKQPHVPFVPRRGLIASYARFRDYHNIHKTRLKRFAKWLFEETAATSRPFCDTFPIMEKALAVKAGLGFMGKNTLFIHKRFGSFVLLSGLLTPLDLPITGNHTEKIDRCGSCNRCQKACPTNALHTPFHLDARRCLAYHSIESKTPIPCSIAKKNPGYVFGCDVCQEACPHNLKQKPTSSKDFLPVRTHLSLEDLKQFEEHPEKLFGNPLKRKSLAGLKEALTSLPTFPLEN